MRIEEPQDNVHEFVISYFGLIKAEDKGNIDVLKKKHQYLETDASIGFFEKMKLRLERFLSV
ncbi:MAG: hypothetical protein EOO42_13795 [Flavobacteriales bacterium]|nr:MAG: hypothetical protein EOO42_13795 [Flavobacteriales bacterium]